MKLLVTNDDGIDSVFFHKLVFALQAARHQLFIAVPAEEQSWSGASKTRARPVKTTLVDHGFGCPTWTVDGTPSDCVNIALAHLLPKQPGAAGPEQTTCVEGVVSGINIGMNGSLGFILASGTIAGAWEGALHGLPAAAFSQDVSPEAYAYLKEHGSKPDALTLDTLRHSADRAAALVGEWFPRMSRNSFTVHNVNFPLPCTPATELRRTVPAQVHVPGIFGPAADDGSHRLIWGHIVDVSPPTPLTDVQCLKQGHISHTILDYRKLGHA